MPISAELEAVIKSYQPTEDGKKLAAESRLLLIAGAAGSGKDSIIKELLQTGDYEFMVSHTTRPARPDETNGQDYYFIDWPTAESMVKAKRFLEVGLVYDDHLFGTSLAELRRIKNSGKIAVTDIDVDGAQAYYDLNPRVKAVFILPPSYEEWIRRLAERDGNKDQAAIRRRLSDAHAWLEQALKAGYFRFVIHTDLNQAVADVKAYAENDAVLPGGADDTRLEHAWHVLGELKRQLNS